MLPTSFFIVWLLPAVFLAWALFWRDRPLSKKSLFGLLLLLFGWIVVGMLVLPEYVFAADAPAQADADIVSRIVNKFANKAGSWESQIQVYAEKILYWFAIFEISWIGIRLALGQANIGEAIKQLVMFILMAGFFLAVIRHYHEWSWNLIDGLTRLGDNIGAPAAASEAPFKAGLDIVGKILKKTSFWSPGDSLGLILVGLIVLFCFALIAARMVLIKCEAMVAMAAAMLLVGFGGSSLTKDYAVNVIRYVLSVAFKLFVMQLVLAIGIEFINEFKVGDTELSELVVIIGASIVLVALVNTLPDTVAGIISGSHIGSGGGLGRVGAAVGGAALGAGVGTIIGGAKALGAAKSLSAASKMADMAGATGFSKVGHMAKNLTSAGQEAKGNKPTRSSIMRERYEAARLAHEGKDK